jgi:hypothetical protein
MTTNSDFERLCRKRLNVLGPDYGFTIAKVEKDCYGVFITYQNSTSFVRISYQPRETGVSVFIGRTVGGIVPPYPTNVEPDTVLHWFDFEDLLALKAPSATILSTTAREQLSCAQLDQALKRIAIALDTYARDIFRGDFSIFEELDRVVKARAKMLRA